MKIYRLNSNINEEMDLEEAIDYLQTKFHFTLDKVETVEKANEQSEMIEVLLDTYFIIDETEDEEDTWEDDTSEREIEYRKVQGF